MIKEQENHSSKLDQFISFWFYLSPFYGKIEKVI